MKKRLKRILTMILSVALILSGVYVSDDTAKAATSEMSIASVKSMSSNNTVNWRFDFSMNGTWPTTAADAEYIMDDITVTIRDASGTVKEEVTGGPRSEGEYLTSFKSGSDWVLRIFSNHTAPNVPPVVGDTLTISSGQMVDKANATKIVNFAKQQVLQWDGTKWTVSIAQTVEEMSIASVAAMSAANDVNWRFDFNMNGTWPTTETNAEYIMDDLTVTIRDAAGNVKAEVKGGTGSTGEYVTSFKSASAWILRIFSTYTAPNKPPTVGDTLTISSGQMVDKADATKVVKFAKVQAFQWNGTEWSSYIEQTIEEMSVASVASMSSANTVNWRFDFNMNGTWPTTETNAEYIMDDITVTIRDASGTVKEEVTGGPRSEGEYLTSFKSDSVWILRIFSTHTAPNVPPVVGDTLTISRGQMVDKADASKIVNFAEELVLEYDGSIWTIYEGPIVYDYADMTLVWGEYPSNQPNKENGYWDLYVETSATVPGTVGTTVYSDIQVVTGDTIVPAVIKKAADNLLNIYIEDEGTLPVTAPAGTKITIKAGESLGSDLGTTGIRITEDFVMVLGEDGKVKEYEIVYDYTDMKLVWGNHPSNYPNKEKGWWDLYVDTSVEVPGTNWTTVYMDIKVMVGEQEVPATIKKAGKNVLNIFIKNDEILPVTVPAGTEITVKAGKSLGSDLDTKGINLTADFTMVLGEDGKLIEKGRKIEYVDITLTRLVQDVCVYKPSQSRWNVYINIEGEMPGTAWQGYFGPVEYTVNGKLYMATDVYNAGEYGFFFFIPESVLPSDFTENTTIVIKSGKAAPSVTDQKGIHLTKDFVIYANEHGWSHTGFAKPLEVSQTNAQLTLDRDNVFGGNEHGLYFNTDDTFPVDTTWATKIRALNNDANSGVFVNGNKVNAPIVRYLDGKAYVGLGDAGVTAKDKDKVTIKGVFGSNGYGVSYKEVTFYFNGKIWGTQYEPAKGESYTSLGIKSVNGTSSWRKGAQRWDVYLNMDNMIPGDIDKIHFSKLTVEIDGKEMQTIVYHSFQHTMFFPIGKEYLPENCPDGTKITVKAGKALAADKSTGIELVKDFTFYTYKGSFSDVKPTTNTKWQSVSIVGMNRTVTYKKSINSWLIHLKLNQELETEIGTNYLKLPIQISGKVYELTATRDGEFLMLTIPGDILDENAKRATLTLAAGARGYANGGHNGIEIAEEFNMYLFNKVISEQEFTEMQEYEGRILGVQNAMDSANVCHVYLRLNKEFPGTEWFENYDDFVYYYNGKKIEASACKSGSSNGKFMYFAVDKKVVGEPKEGDIIKILGGTVMTCGGYRMTITDEFQLMYEDGLWSQYVQTDVKAPEDNKSLWEIARFDSEYIPVTENGSVVYSNEDIYNKISSIEPMKDFTVSFNAKKFHDDEVTPTFGVILRGNAISEDEEMTRTLLNGYVITFSVLETKDENDESIWTGYINLWKNGENYSLLDQYRISYVHDKNDHPYFQTDVDYNYEFSIYNITETCVCITVRVNGKLAMRYYDEAGSDPFDPAINAGTFQVFAGCPNYITDDIAELTTVIAEKDACKVGEKVRVAATYPSVLEGAEYEIEQKGATIKDGLFVAEKPGTYTIHATYKGEKLEAKTITVTEVAETDGETNAKIPMLPIVLGITGIVAIGACVAFVIIRRKRAGLAE